MSAQGHLRKVTLRRLPGFTAIIDFGLKAKPTPKLGFISMV